jgi:hypothetical protein
MVSLTAAKTSRILVVSVAWVRLQESQLGSVQGQNVGHILRVEVEVCSVDLVEPPKKILCGTIHVISTRVVGEVVSKW